MTHAMGMNELLFLILVTIMGIVIWTLAVTPVGGACIW